MAGMTQDCSKTANPAGTHKLCAAVMTSCGFNTNTPASDHFWQDLGTAAGAVEIYAFMHPDCQDLAVDFWNSEHIPGVPANSTERSLNREKWYAPESVTCPLFLARLNIEEIQHIAEKLSLKAQEHGIKLPAIATFLPEIASHQDFNLSHIIQRSLASVMLLAAEIGQRLKCDPPVIEIVAGSRVQRIIRSSGLPTSFTHIASPNIFYAQVIAADVGRQRVIEAVNHAFDIAGRKGWPSDFTPESLRVALELEPGPWFLLRDETSLSEFAKDISASGGFANSGLGFNLDIAHWYMAGIDPKFVRDNEPIRNRIRHAHISGHSRRGHIGDFSLEQISGKPEETAFRDWLDLLASLKPDYDVDWSNTVSLEYEASGSLTSTLKSLNVLLSWL